MKFKAINQRKRVQQKVAPYVPQYKQMDIEPERLDFQPGTQVQRTPQEKSPRLRTIGLPIQEEVPAYDEGGNSFEFVENNRFVDPNTPMIDNNNFIEDEPLEDEDSSIGISDLEPEQYVLIVSGTMFSMGTSKEIEKEINLLVFGNHPRCNESIPIDNLIVLKRIDIKAGVFLNE